MMIDQERALGGNMPCSASSKYAIAIFALANAKLGSRATARSIGLRRRPALLAIEPQPWSLVAARRRPATSAAAPKDRHAFKTELDDEARRAMFPQNERLKV